MALGQRGMTCPRLQSMLRCDVDHLYKVRQLAGLLSVRRGCKAADTCDAIDQRQCNQVLKKQAITSLSTHDVQCAQQQIG